MKKIVIFTLAMIISIATYSQDFYKVIKSNFVKYEYDEWVCKKTVYPEDLYIVVDGDEIKINNAKSSVYKAYGNSEKKVFSNHTSNTFNAIDRNGKDCHIIIKRSTSGAGSSVSIFYFEDALGFEYILDN